MADLPIELLHNIFSYASLQDIQDYILADSILPQEDGVKCYTPAAKSFRQVCRLWKDLVDMRSSLEFRYSFLRNYELDSNSVFFLDQFLSTRSLLFFDFFDYLEPDITPSSKHLINALDAIHQVSLLRQDLISMQVNVRRPEYIRHVLELLLMLRPDSNLCYLAFFSTERSILIISIRSRI